MRERWQPVLVLGLALFVINAVARFIVWQASPGEGDQTLIGLVAIGAVAALMVAGGYRWAVRYDMPRVVGELSVAALLGCLLSILVGPFAGGSVPGREGAAFVVAEIWHYLLAAAVGGALGVLLAVALGRDRKSQAWKRYVQTARSRPRRSVRR